MSNIGEANKMVRILQCLECGVEIKANCTLKKLCFKCRQSNKRKIALLAKHKKNGNTIS